MLRKESYQFIVVNMYSQEWLVILFIMTFTNSYTYLIYYNSGAEAL